MNGGRFGDGAPMPVSAIKPFDARNPTLEHVYTLALEARRRGQPYVFVTASGEGRPWVMSLVAFGVRGLVVRRIRGAQTADALRNGEPADAGPIVTLIVRFAVIDVFAAYQRDYLKRTNTNSARLSVNRRRRPFSRSVIIR
jgi:hypothetical protein